MSLSVTDLRKKLRKLISSEKKLWEASSRDSNFVELVASNPDKEFDGVSIICC